MLTRLKSTQLALAIGGWIPSPATGRPAKHIEECVGMQEVMCVYMRIGIPGAIFTNMQEAVNKTHGKGTISINYHDDKTHGKGMINELPR